MKLGAVLSSTGMPFRKACLEFARAGLRGIQIDAAGDFHPKQLTGTGRRELRNILKSNDLELTAVAAPLRHGLDTATNQQPRIDQVRQAMDFAVELGVRLVIVQAGRVPAGDDDPRGPVLRESLLALSAHGDRTGCLLALETGLESGADLAAYLGRFDSGALAVNYDPANLLVNGLPPLDSLAPLKGRIVHVHARDARSGGASRTARETALGAGDIDWMSLAATLAVMEYRGWWTLERETGADRWADIVAGAKVLRTLAV